MWGGQGFNQGQGGFNQGFNQGQGFNQIQTSPHYGGNGGGPGEHKGPNFSLIGIRGKAGSAIDRLQLLFVDVNTGQCVETPAFGGNGGGPFQFVCPPGQWIDKIRVKYDKFMRNIQVETNTGVASGKFGGHEGKEDYLNVSGKRITGASWRAGSLVDGIQFHYTS